MATKGDRRLFARAMGRAVRAERERQGLGQKALARVLRVRQQSVSRYEQGARHLSTTQIVDIAELLGLTVTELLHRTEIELKRGDDAS